MILPDKYIPVNETFLGLGAIALGLLRDSPKSISHLRREMLRHHEVGNYARFVYTLDFLYALGLVEISKGMIRRTAI
jgi:hypothetical protein